MVKRSGRRIVEDDSDDETLLSRLASSTQEGGGGAAALALGGEHGSGTNATTMSAAEMLHSLQPVRDLAQNFDIDIATYLDEYLEKLLDALDAGRPIGGDDEDVDASAAGATASTAGGLDFAQAALLVQNSSAVYGRKVDYFSTLVVKALEGFQSSVAAAGLSHPANIRPRGGTRGGAGNAAANATDEDRAFWELLRDDNYDFLALDDVMPLAKPSDITRGTAERLRRARNNSSDRRGSLSRLSLSFHTLQSTLPSLSQQMLSSSRSHHHHPAESSLSHLGTSLLDQLDVGQPGSGTGNVDDLPYRVPKYHTLNLVGSKCEITANGALLLPGVADASNLFRAGGGGRGRKVPVVVQASMGTDDEEIASLTTNGGTTQRDRTENDPIGTTNDQHHHNDDNDDGGNFPMDDDDDDDADRDNTGPGYDFGGDDNPENREAGPTRSLPQHPQRAGVLRNAQNAAQLVKKSVTFDDPWELLDPHQPMGTHRPMKKGMTLVVPDGLTDLPSDCVTGARTKRRARKDGNPLGGQAARTTNKPLSGSYATDAYRNWSNGTDAPELSLTDLAFGEEFAHLVKRTRQLLVAEKRKARLAARNAAGDPIEGKNDAIEDDHDDGFGAFGNDDDYDDYERDDSGGVGNWGDDDDGGITGNAGLSTVDEAFSGDDEGGLTFEELCRARIQEFAKGAEKYANETQLLQRVRKWQEKLHPLLEEEERRDVFDIHKYGQSIIASIQDELAAGGFEDDGHAVPFEAIARDRPKYDVARLFLAALSLCNSGNVIIDEDLNLQLVSPVVEHPMETFLAPSVREHQ